MSVQAIIQFSESSNTNIVVNFVLRKLPSFLLSPNEETSTNSVVDDIPDKIIIQVCSKGTFFVRKYTATRRQHSFELVRTEEEPKGRTLETALDIAFGMCGANRYYLELVKVFYGDECDDEGFPISSSCGKTELRKSNITKEYILTWLEAVLKLGKY